MKKNTTIFPVKTALFALLTIATTGILYADNIMDQVDKKSKFYEIVSGSKKMMGAATAAIGKGKYGAAPYAVFVPTDEALGKALKATGKDKEAAKDIILAHVVPVESNDDAAIRAQLAGDGEEAGPSSMGGSTITLVGNKLAVNYDPEEDDAIPANSPSIVGSGVKTGNGHVYKIDGVLAK